MSNDKQTPDTEQTDQVDENHIIAERRARLGELREQGVAFPNTFRRDSLAGELREQFDSQSKAELEQVEDGYFTVAGRIMAKRDMGKVSFLQIQDMSGRIQLFVSAKGVGGNEFYKEHIKTLDIGDIVGAGGTIFKTNTGELSLNVDRLELLTKSLRPLPDKFHGLKDPETRYRQRYVDLIVNEEAQAKFKMRNRLISYMRRFLDERNFMEVETPMMQVIPGGATAKPFETYHNALDMPMFLRISPELYLKRLVVGGFERVYEINRSFRNEGVSTRHNPEFTMVEFYMAYADYLELMDLTEEMLRGMAQDVVGSMVINYGERDYDLSQPFKRISMADSVLEAKPDLDAGKLRDRDYLVSVAAELGIKIKDGFGPGKLLTEIFEELVESNLMEPTFITDYPAEVSPLARRNDNDPFITDRFEFFLAGRELANGFSELNDPEDQAKRFDAQVAEKEAGDDEAMFFDNDYVTALEYGLCPTAGEGIGIDRLVMFFTDSPSIREVILFPHMRQQAG